MKEFPMKEGTLREITTFLNDMGNLVYFDQLVILDPLWLSRLMASLISGKNHFGEGIGTRNLNELKSIESQQFSNRNFTHTDFLIRGFVAFLH